MTSPADGAPATRTPPWAGHASASSDGIRSGRLLAGTPQASSASRGSLMTAVSLCYAILALVTASVPTPEARLAQATQTMKSTPVSITATIEAIDKTNRIVTLKGPKGNLVDTYVDESYKRFNQLKVGDQ